MGQRAVIVRFFSAPVEHCCTLQKGAGPEAMRQLFENKIIAGLRLECF